MGSTGGYLYWASVILATTLLTGSADVTFTEAQPAQTSSPATPNPTGALHDERLAEASCASCHGLDGNNTTSPQIPKIAGQNAGYIREQLHAFKNGTRKSEIMSALVPSLTDAQIAELARYFSRQPIKSDSAADTQLASIGARIFRYPARGGPPCVACHGGNGAGFGGMMRGGMGMMGGHMAMMGVTGPVPNLSGQHAAYTLQQLDAFASRARGSTVMDTVAQSLSERDRRAVAEYLSGLR